VEELMTQEYDKAAFRKKWAETILKCPDDPFHIAAQLVNTTRNFQTAVCILFDLSFVSHKEYIMDCAKYWKDNLSEGSVIDYDYCVEFQQHYINEVVPYPSDA
jgi:hypothetical protein